VIAGAAGVPARNGAKRENETAGASKRLRAFDAFAGGTPAVPAIT